MEWLLTTINGQLQAFVTSSNQAISEGDLLAQLGHLSLALSIAIAAVAGTGTIVRTLRRSDEKLHERLRFWQAEHERAEAKLSQVRQRNDELLEGTPERFLERMDQAQRDNVFSQLSAIPTRWLEPLRPALARAYRALAREQLLEAETQLDIEEARHSAWGAFAAVPSEPAHGELLALIDEAAEAIHIQRLSEAEVAELRLARTEQNSDGLRQAATKFRERGKYRVALVFAERASQVAIAQQGPYSKSAWQAGYARALCLAKLARHEEAEALTGDLLDNLRQSSEFERDGYEQQQTKLLLANCLSYLGRGKEAAAIARPLYVALRKADGSESLRSITLQAGEALAFATVNVEDYEEAERLYRELSSLMRERDDYGPEHEDTLRTRHQLGVCVGKQGRYAEAEEHLSAVHAVRRRDDKLGPEHPDTLLTRKSLAVAMGRQGRVSEAVEHLQSVISILMGPDSVGPDHPHTQEAQASLRDLQSAALPRFSV